MKRTIATIFIAAYAMSAPASTQTGVELTCGSLRGVGYLVLRAGGERLVVAIECPHGVKA